MDKLGTYKKFYLLKITLRDFKLSPSIRDTYTVGEVLVFDGDNQTFKFGEERASAPNEAAAREYLDMMESQNQEAVNPAGTPGEIGGYEKYSKFLDVEEKVDHSSSFDRYADFLNAEEEAVAETQKPLAEASDLRLKTSDNIIQDDAPSLPSVPEIEEVVECSKPAEVRSPQENVYEDVMRIVGQKILTATEEMERAKANALEIERQLKASNERELKLEESLKQAQELAQNTSIYQQEIAAEKAARADIENNYAQALENLRRREKSLADTEIENAALRQEIQELQANKAALLEDKKRGDNLKDQLERKDKYIKSIDDALALKEKELKESRAKEQEKEALVVSLLKGNEEEKRAREEELAKIRAKSKELEERIKQLAEERAEQKQIVKAAQAKQEGIGEGVVTEHGVVTVKLAYPEAKPRTQKQKAVSKLLKVKDFIVIVLVCLAATFFITMLLNNETPTETLSRFLTALRF